MNMALERAPNYTLGMGLHFGLEGRVLSFLRLCLTTQCQYVVESRGKISNPHFAPGLKLGCYQAELALRA